MKKNTWIYKLIIIGVLIILTTSCKKKDESTKDIVIGNDFGGGKVAYIFQPGETGYVSGEVHGLIAAPTDQSLASASWGCIGTTINGADGTALGTGNQNTIDIINGCSTSDIAARLCYNLELGGYSDWYLPSKDELNKLYLAKDVIGNFSTGSYWTSSEYAGYETSHAWLQGFGGGIQAKYYKDGTWYVRAVRSF